MVRSSRRKCVQVTDLRSDLVEALFEQVSGVPAWARPAVADVEEFLDVPQSQPHALRALDEPHPLRRRRRIAPVAGGRPFRGASSPSRS
jgi:hypothetical protein